MVEISKLTQTSSFEALQLQGFLKRVSLNGTATLKSMFSQAEARHVCMWACLRRPSPPAIFSTLIDPSGKSSGFQKRFPCTSLAPPEGFKHELDQLLELLPIHIKRSLEEHPELPQLVEIVLDLGRYPVARFPSGDSRLAQDVLTTADLEQAISRVGDFADDNRAGIDRTLHRISAIRNRPGRIIGLTCRVGRSVSGSAEMARDLVEKGGSLLLMGPPGVGKTTAIREIARMLADEYNKRVIIVDTSNEIAGDGDIPHPGIGRARRMQVANVDMQHKMPRKRGAEWDFVTKLKTLPKGNFSVRCKYCSHTWDGGANRVRAHLLGLKGYGVGSCESAPENVKDICRKLHGRTLDSASGSANINTQSHAESYADVSVSQCDDGGLGESSVGHAMKKAKSSKGALDKAWDVQARKEANKAVRRYFFAEDIPFWKVRSPYFLDMLQAVGRVGQSYKPPSYQQLRSKELHEEVRTIEGDIIQIRDAWKIFGCSIMCDGWSDTRNRPIINVMVSCIYGTVFLKSVDTSCEVKSGEFIFEILKDAIKDVGEDNVVQIVMDNASNCIRAGHLVEEQWPHIFYTRCTCHCLDLLFEDIGKLAWVKPVLENATKIVTFVTMKPTVLALFRKFSQKDLVKPAPTRFAYAFIMLTNLLDERVYNGLRSLMVCPEYTRKRVAKSQKAEELSAIVLSPFFWRNVREIIAVCSPILKILRLADREGATMGLIYELTDRMIEKISSLDCIDSTRLEEVKSLCIERWEMLHTPLHAAGYVLHPIWRAKSPHMDTEVYNGWMDVIERYTRGDVKKQGQLCDELDVYKSLSGAFSRPVVRDESRMHYAVRWWKQFGPCVPNLQKLALRILSQGSCASPCERNWSTFSLIHTKRRNRLLPKNVEKLVYIHTNLRLISKIQERGFQKIEVTLDMIEKEADDQRLIALQAEHDGEIVVSSAHTLMESHEDCIEEDEEDEEDCPIADDDDDDDVGDEDV